MRLRKLRWRALALCLWLLSVGIPAQAQWMKRLDGVTSLAFAPDGQWLAAGSIEDWVSPGDLRIWDVGSGQLRHKVRYDFGVESLAFSPDGKNLAVVSNAQGGSIRLWNTQTWRLQRRLGRANNEFELTESVAFSPDGRHLLSGGSMAEEGTADDMYLWDLQRRHARKLPASNGVSSVAFSPRNDLILAAFFTGYYNDASESIRAWDARSGRFLWKKPQPHLSSLALMPDGRRFLTGTARSTSEDERDLGGALQIRQTRDGAVLHTIAQSSGISAVATSPDGRWWATGDRRGIVRLWNAKTQRPIKTLTLHRKSIRCIAFSPHTRFLASAGADDFVRLTRLP